MRQLLIVLMAWAGFSCATPDTQPKDSVEYIDPFICTGGDRGQTDVAAAVPFGMAKPCPDSDPINHSGYNFNSDKILGFSNTRFSGVGCKGTGGNLRLLPFVGTINADAPGAFKINKATEKALPGFYAVEMNNGIKVELTATRQVAFHRYHFPENVDAGILFDLAASFEKVLQLNYTLKGKNVILGDVKCDNVCKKGKYKFYFAIKVDTDVAFSEQGNKVVGLLPKDTKLANVYVGMSTVSSENALKTIELREKLSFEEVKSTAKAAWSNLVNTVEVETENDTLKKLFYTHLYHVSQSPFQVKDFDGRYRASDNKIYQLNENDKQYFGWSIWDTFRSKHPLFSLIYPEQYSDILTSMCKLYEQGKQPWATETEPFPTIRTEHAVALILDGYRKGLLNFDLKSIYPAIKNEMDTQLEWHSPGHVLESSYDSWAFAQIAKELGYNDDHKKYMDIAMNYKETWQKVFLNLEDDADVMHARGLYEGTLWQYRWFVPFDIAGIQEMVGGKKVFEEQLDTFFGNELFNVGNQPDIQVPFLYNYTDSPWKSQQLVQQLLTEEVANWYGTHKKWKKPEVRKIFQAKPEGYISQMDDDAGTMSGWYLMASMGLYQTCPGEPYFWVTIPLFSKIKIHLPDEKSFTISVEGPISSKSQIEKLVLNGKTIDGLKLNYADIYSGGNLVIKTK
ncbi:glycoside hydrolase family 92 protein [Prolixibacteraceae bacterium JC049]|nr:glycoside hydrolase family 92 protein [Prolixibacteraceae bacterium JC049]